MAMVEKVLQGSKKGVELEEVCENVLREVCTNEEHEFS